MDWNKILEMKDPREALKAMDSKVRQENLPLVDMMEMVEKYTQIHGIEMSEMAFYPNGERVLGD